MGGNWPRNRLALPIEIRQQRIAPLLIQPTAGTLHRSQPLAHLLRHLQRPPLLRQRQPQRPPRRRIALGVLQQQFRQPGRPQRFQVLGIEAGAAGHGNKKRGVRRIRGKARSAAQRSRRDSRMTVALPERLDLTEIRRLDRDFDALDRPW